MTSNRGLQKCLRRHFRLFVQLIVQHHQTDRQSPRGAIQLRLILQQSRKTLLRHGVPLQILLHSRNSNTLFRVLRQSEKGRFLQELPYLEQDDH